MEPNELQNKTEMTTTPAVQDAQAAPAPAVAAVQPADDGTLLGGQQTQPNPAPAGAPEHYDFSGSLPQGAELDESEAGNFGNLCRELNLTNDQANKFAKYGMEYAQRVSAAMQDARTAEVAGWADTAKQELGNEYDKTVHSAAIGVEAAEKVVPGLREALNSTGAGNRVEFIRAFAMLGDLVREDPTHDGGAKSAPTDEFAKMYPNTNWERYK
nr:MAG TPA: putative protease [Caudoviricetes sp.]